MPVLITEGCIYSVLLSGKSVSALSPLRSLGSNPSYTSSCGPSAGSSQPTFICKMGSTGPTTKKPNSNGCI